MELSSQMILFARVVQAGSFSAAARTMNLSPSAISRQIGYLEDGLGVRLLNRTRDGIIPTDEGRAFFERCDRVADTVAEAKEYLDGLSGEPTGHLRVVSTVAFGHEQLLPVLPRFLDENPQITLSLRLTDELIDLSAGEYDAAIQFSEALSQEHIITRKLAPNRRILVASPAYVEAYGNPRTREELDQHACLRLTTVADWNDWIPAAVLKRPMRFEGNSAYVVYKAVLGGLGIARLSEYLVGIDVAEGRLVRVLPDYEQFDSTIVISYLDRRNLSPKIRALVDFLANHFLPIPPWER
ncbi:MAG: LysR family transcriptional regulator [Rhodobacterales bacterium]|nr:LysR family transcriptional regulator [Rhodobacterales bacterium]